MDELLKAIKDLRSDLSNLQNDLNKRIDLLEASLFKDNTILIKDIHEKLTDIRGSAITEMQQVSHM